MSFLSGESIKDRLKEIIFDEHNSPCGIDSQIDCNSYSLKVGREVCITNSKLNINGASILKLNNGDAFTIPGGHFSMIITEEFVTIPKDLMGFISIKANIKFRGLVNVSGFHVDPGWEGRLLFSVYNAGPNPISLKQGELMFLIWFAQLDNQQTTYVKKPPTNRQGSIPSDKISNWNGPVHSPQTITSRLDKLENSFDRKWWSRLIGLGMNVLAFIFGILIGIAMDVTEDYLNYHKGYKSEIVEQVTNRVLDERNKKK